MVFVLSFLEHSLEQYRRIRYESEIRNTAITFFKDMPQFEFSMHEARSLRTVIIYNQSEFKGIKLITKNERYYNFQFSVNFLVERLRKEVTRV